MWTHLDHPVALHHEDRSKDRTRVRFRDHVFRHHTNKEKNRRRKPHPHLPEKPGRADRITRFLGGVVLPTSWHNSWRDSGAFRSVIEGLMTLSAPTMMLTQPTMVRNFVRMTRRCRRFKYGPHPRHILEVYVPTSTNLRTVPPKLVLFIHGGAWGSGTPPFYRLVAPPFLEAGMAVAVVGYRTYPCGRLDEQVSDCLAALQYLSRTCSYINESVVVVGHSSGAHVGLCMLVQLAQQRLLREHAAAGAGDNGMGERIPSRPAVQDCDEAIRIESFVGLSGPYDISHHFDYEAARGVEELSPMKAVCGYTREAFRRNSPALRLKDFLAREDWNEGVAPTIDACFPKMALIHGMEDDTVPFTATAEAAHVLRSCGLTRCQEFYIPQAGHQDTVMQLMLGGRTREAVMEWLTRPASLEQPTSILKATSKL